MTEENVLNFVLNHALQAQFCRIALHFIIFMNNWLNIENVTSWWHIVSVTLREFEL